MSEFKFLDQLSNKDLHLLEDIKSDFKKETGKDFFLKIDSLDYILNHYRNILENIPEPKTKQIQRVRRTNFVNSWYGNEREIFREKVFASDLDKTNSSKIKVIKTKIGFVKQLKKKLENELLKKSMIPEISSKKTLDIIQSDPIFNKLSKETKDLIQVENGNLIWKGNIKMFCENVINETYNPDMEFDLYVNDLYNKFEFAKFPDYTVKRLIESAKKHKAIRY